MRMVLAIAGALTLAGGLLFICQGCGLVRWPASSFMIDQRPWVLRGALIGLAGAALLWLAMTRRFHR